MPIPKRKKRCGAGIGEIGESCKSISASESFAHSEFCAA